jgi:hypothetical protein
MATRFDAVAPKRIAAGNKLEASITSTGRVWRAHVTWKAGWTGSESVVAYSEEQLHNELRRMDKTVTFASTQASSSPTTNAQDDAMLEAMRDDPGVKDAAYFNACRRFGVAPQARPNFDVPIASAKPFVSAVAQNNALERFLATHPALSDGGWFDFNSKLVIAWHDAEELPLTAQSLEQSFNELWSHGMFRDAQTGKRGGRIVRSFDIELLRHDRAKAAASAAPVVQATETQADVMARAKRLVLTARPDLNSVDGMKSDEFRKLRDGLLTQWARSLNPKLARGNSGAGPVLDGQGFPVYRS